jgi:hypothetical protein
MNSSSADMLTKFSALIFDEMGLGCLVLSLSGETDLGIFFSFLPDILGIGFIGGPNLLQKTGNKKHGLLFTILGKIFPFIGDILPLWSFSAFRRKK